MDGDIRLYIGRKRSVRLAVELLLSARMTMNLLLVEDDSLLGKSVQRGLTDAGHQCDWVTDGEEAIRQASSESFDVIVLDLMLPDMSGLEVLQRLRADGNETPVLILTALGSVDERVTGLQAGADDYLVKPFAFAELAARLEALSRRASKAAKTELREGPIVLDLRTRRATRDGHGNRIDANGIQFARVPDAKHESNGHSTDAVRALVGGQLGRRHERDRSPYQPTAGQSRSRLRRAIDPHRARNRLCPTHAIGSRGCGRCDSG